MSKYILPGLYSGVPALVQPVFSSSLSLSTILIILLNLIFRIGIAHHKDLIFRPGVDGADLVFDFMDKQGSAWGARREVVYKAISAMNEFFEIAMALGLARGDIKARVTFDELNLDVDMSYEGRLPELPSTQPTGEDLLAGREEMAKLSGFMIRRYADSVKTDERDGTCRVRLHFDH